MTMTLPSALDAEQNVDKNMKISVVGLGYVGLPLAVALSR